MSANRILCLFLGGPLDGQIRKIADDVAAFVDPLIVPHVFYTRTQAFECGGASVPIFAVSEMCERPLDTLIKGYAMMAKKLSEKVD